MRDERREAELITALNISLVLTGFVSLYVCLMHTPPS
jgi:hypothetical protein